MVQRTGTRPVHGRACKCFDRLQIETAGLAQTGEDNMEQLIYFADDFLPDRFGRFFPEVSTYPQPAVPDRSFRSLPADRG